MQATKKVDNVKESKEIHLGEKFVNSRIEENE